MTALLPYNRSGDLISLTKQVHDCTCPNSYYTGSVLINILNYVGVFAFAVFGARKALEHQFDLFGIFLCAFLTALGGGTIREIIIHHSPIYFHDPRYVAVTAVGSAFAVATYTYFSRIERYMLLLDTIGLVVFALVGCQRASDAGLGLTGMVFFAVLTAAGGGMLADIVTSKRPVVLHGDFYTMPAILFACEYSLAAHYTGRTVVVYALLLNILVLRLLAMYLGVKIWRPYHHKYNPKRNNPIMAVLSPYDPTD